MSQNTALTESVRSCNDTVSNGLGEDNMRELGERVREDEEESGRHDKTKSATRERNSQRGGGV